MTRSTVKGSIFKHHRRIKGERVLDLPEYRAWLKKTSSGSLHHYFTRSDIFQNDFFIKVIPFDEHAAIHHESGLTPKQWAEEQGLETLIDNSIDTMTQWLDETEHPKKQLFTDALFSIYSCPEKDHAVQVTRELATGLKR